MKLLLDLIGWKRHLIRISLKYLIVPLFKMLESVPKFDVDQRIRSVCLCVNRPPSWKTRTSHVPQAHKDDPCAKLFWIACSSYCLHSSPQKQCQQDFCSLLSVFSIITPNGNFIRHFIRTVRYLIRIVRYDTVSWNILEPYNLYSNTIPGCI